MNASVHKGVKLTRLLYENSVRAHTHPYCAQSYRMGGEGATFSGKCENHIKVSDINQFGGDKAVVDLIFCLFLIIERLSEFLHPIQTSNKSIEK